MNMNGQIISEIMKKFEKDAQKMEFSYTFDNILRHRFKQYVKVSYCVNDQDIKEITRHFANKYNYLSCPHSACSLFGAVKFMNDHNTDIPMVAVATASPAKFPKIIKGFLKNDMDGKRELFEKELNHRFLPKVGDKEECIKLTSGQFDDDWSSRWTQRLKNDIIARNKDSLRSKL